MSKAARDLAKYERAMVEVDGEFCIPQEENEARYYIDLGPILGRVRSPWVLAGKFFLFLPAMFLFILATRMAPYKLIGVTLRDGADGDGLARYGEIAARDEARITLHVPRDEAPERAARLVNDLGDRLADISVEDPPIEDVIDKVFTQESAS